MPTIKTDFVISGEKQYKQAISEINSGLGVLNAEMKKVTAEYQDNANSVEALTAKGDVLERTLLSQKEKVEELRRALEHAKQEYGEADKRTMEWEKSLNLAEAAVANTEHAIRKNNDALEDAKRGMQSTEGTSINLGSAVSELANKFGIQLPQGLGDALGGMQGFSAGSVAAVGAVVAAVAALIDIEKKLISLTLEAASHADDILTMSQITGLSTDTIQELQYAANLIDVPFDTIKGSLTKLKNAQQDARDGNAKMQASFERLGVSIVDANGELRDSEEVFYEVIDALGRVENATERDALAMDIFGRKAEDLNPLILQGSDRLRELSQEAHNASYVITEEGLAALGAVDDAYQRLQLTQEGVRAQIAEEMAPAVEELYTVWTEYIKNAGEELVKSGVIEGLGEILKSVVALIPALGELTGAVLPEMGTALNDIAKLLQMIGYAIAGIADFIDLIDGLYPWNWGSGKAKNALGFGYNSGNPSHTQAYEMQVTGSYGAYQQRHNGTADYSGWVYDPKTGKWTAPEYQNSGSGSWTAEDAARYSWDEDTQRWYDNVEHKWIPGNSTGNMHFVGGRTIVGENGPEAVELPEGSRIWNAQDTRMGAGSGGVVIYGNVVLDASKVQDLVDAAKFLEDLNVVRRMK